MAESTVSRLEAQTPGAEKWMAIWLLVCCALIFAMVVLGGVTRLTGSGLSIVEWRPLSGALPPSDDTAFEEAFRKYQQSPEYGKVNPGMSLDDFKVIFWIEYAHRLLGRAIGGAFLLPFLYFLATRKLGRDLALKLGAIFLLGGLEGALGWFMVQSGLIDHPEVSPYRLVAHLGVAVVIYGLILWVALGLLRRPHQETEDRRVRGLRRLASAVLALVFVTMLSGGFVAGLNAGLAYNTFPLMDGRLVPREVFDLEPLVRNFFENVQTVQFDHRLLAVALAVAVPALWLRGRRLELPARTRAALHLLLIMVAVQASLGVLTLLLYVPLPLAAAHQAGALALFTSALWLRHELKSARA
ncbi:MAG: COX15/CtaA family protein [Alphaproteobacteria bacterium]